MLFISRFIIAEKMLPPGPNFNGKFNIKSAYDLINCNTYGLNGTWSWLWGLKIPAKVVTFFWLILKDKLMSNSLRAKRHMCDSSVCTRCNYVEETSIHIIRDCIKAQKIWKYFVNISHWDANTSNVDWLKANVCGMNSVYLDGIPWIFWFASISFLIWKDRNTEVINSENNTDAGMCAQIASWAREVFQAFFVLNIRSKFKSPKFIAWSPPCAGYYKVNTDGSVNMANGRCGFGGIIRDAEANWLGGFYGRLEACTSLEVEIHAMFVGLEVIKSKNLGESILETDSLVAYKLVRDQSDSEHQMVALIEDVKALCFEIKTEVQYSLREGNQCADFLAKLEAS